MKEFPRRTVLRSLGGAVIGLPFLEEMQAAKPSAEVPVRAFNLFFGLGIPAPLQEEGFADVLQPLEALKEKLLILRHVDQTRADQKGMNAHFDGACAAFTAEAPRGEAQAGGPSLDQVIRKSAYPDGLPPGMVPSLVAGTFFRRSRVCRYVHSYLDDGTVSAPMLERPRDVFDRVFGQVSSGGEVDPREERIKRSVLDTVVEQYRYYTGGRSPLGKDSRNRVADHLDRIREYELRAFSRERMEGAPEAPPASKLAHGGVADPGGEGIDMELAALCEEWHLMADLYALAIQMDRVRFGALTFLAAGERLRLKGRYEFGGKERFFFDDAAHLRASGSKGCSHEWWHRFREDKGNEQLRAHAHMKMREVAYFLYRLDQADAREANGR
ncbi:MAG: DUF1552 domain-containing protein, partial [Verrucomicrobiota bacterium]